MNQLDQMKLENEMLRTLVQQDPLTGLLNRKATEQRVQQILVENVSGALLMIDIDEFKYINDIYGHLTADRLLQELGSMMNFIFFSQDIVGRLGGDEFAVFLLRDCTRELIDSRVTALQSGALLAGMKFGIKNGPHLTVGAEFPQAGDTFQSLYDRADSAMREGKKDWQMVLHFYAPAIAEYEGAEWNGSKELIGLSDMKYILRNLKEAAPKEGAYCQDYQTFLSIYRFLERGLNRYGLKIHLLLLSLTDLQGAFICLEERGSLIAQLKESIRISLRFSDIYAQYSTCQFLIMLPGAMKENIDVITSRIQNAFRVRIADRADLLLSFSSYPLEAARSNDAEPPLPHGTT